MSFQGSGSSSPCSLARRYAFLGLTAITIKDLSLRKGLKLTLRVLCVGNLFYLYDFFFHKRGWVDVDRLVRALPLVTFFFLPSIEEVKFREQSLSLLIISHIVVEQNAQGRNRRVHWEESRPCQRLRIRVFDQWLYRLTSDKPREPQEGDLASFLRL